MSEGTKPKNSWLLKKGPKMYFFYTKTEAERTNWLTAIVHSMRKTAPKEATFKKPV